MIPRTQWPRHFARIFIVLILVAAGCGGEERAGSEDAAPGTETGLEEARQLVEAAMQAPEWSPPGPSFDASKAAGKTVMIIGVTEAVPVVKEVGDFLEEALAEAGVETRRGDGKGSPTEFARLMDLAIVEGADAIALLGIDPAAVTEPLERTADAGIEVTLTLDADPREPLPANVFGRADFSYYDAGRLMAAWAAVDSGGAANAVYITASDASVQRMHSEGLEEGWQEFCSACELETADVHVPDWGNRLGPLVRSTLTANPDIDYLLPAFDGMALSIVPAVHEAGAADQVVIGTLNGTPAVMELLRAKDIVKMDIGQPNPWLAWATADQILRSLAGVPALEDERVPLRLFTHEVLAPLADNPGEWYGPADFKNGYRELWGFAAKD